MVARFRAQGQDLRREWHSCISLNAQLQPTTSSPCRWANMPVRRPLTRYNCWLSSLRHQRRKTGAEAPSASWTHDLSIAAAHSRQLPRKQPEEASVFDCASQQTKKSVSHDGGESCVWCEGFIEQAPHNSPPQKSNWYGDRENTLVERTHGPRKHMDREDTWVQRTHGSTEHIRVERTHMD